MVTNLYDSDIDPIQESVSRRPGAPLGVRKSLCGASEEMLLLADGACEGSNHTGCGEILQGVLPRWLWRIWRMGKTIIRV